MTSAPPDPKVVLQAHALRSKASGQAVLHGTRGPRTQRTVLGTLYGSAIIAAVIALIVLVAEKIVALI